MKKPCKKIKKIRLFVVFFKNISVVLPYKKRPAFRQVLTVLQSGEDGSRTHDLLTASQALY